MLPLFIRLIRSEMMEVLETEYIKFAWAKGFDGPRDSTLLTKKPDHFHATLQCSNVDRRPVKSDSSRIYLGAVLQEEPRHVDRATLGSVVQWHSPVLAATKVRIGSGMEQH
jgi:hypothetical protein